MRRSQPLDRVRDASAATPLRVKLISSVLLLATVGLGLASFATTESLHSYLVSRVDDQIKNFANSIRHREYTTQVGPGPGVGSPVPGASDGDDSGTNAGDDPRPPSQIYVQQYGPTGAPSGGVNVTELAASSLPSLPTLTTAEATKLSGHAFTVSSKDGKSSWRVLTVVRDDGSSVVVAGSLSDVNHTTHRVILLETAIGLAALVMIGLAGSFVINRSLRPLVRVEMTAAAIAEGDLGQRVPELPVRTEVGRLSAALNTMLTQIETAFSHERESEQAARASEQRMRQFVADASHELRTPLTSIRGFAELYRMGATSAEMDLPHLMNRIEGEAARMGLMVDDLLLLARLDQQRPLEQQNVDLLVVTTDVVQDARVVAADRQISLTVETQQPPVVTGDESRLRQVLHNLMTNAMNHTPSDTPIDVSLSTTEGSEPNVVIKVADRGPGIDAAARQRIFERFYRVDSSRNRSAGGTGLGLSIVAGLVAAHHGAVAVDARDGGGAVFTVTLPLTSAP